MKIRSAINSNSSQPDIEISENTILDFHLSHRTNPQFKFEPKEFYF